MNFLTEFKGFGIDPDNFLVKLKEEKKAKKYSLNPIQFNKQVAETLQRGAEKMLEFAKEAVENEKSLDVLKTKREQIFLVADWIKTGRLERTREYDSLKAEFTKAEKRIKEACQILKDAEEALLEEKYKTCEDAITRAFTIHSKILEEERSIQIPLSSFQHFIELKRKSLSVFTPSEKTGKLSKTALRQIEEEFNRVAEPLIAAKQREEEIQKELKLFELAMQQADNIEKLKNLSIQIYDFYPLTAEQAKMRVQNKITFLKNKEAEKKRREEEAKKALEKAEQAKVEDEACKVAFEEPEVEEIPENVPTTKEENGKIYKISLEDLEVLAGIEVIAETREEAIQKITDVFKAHLEMIL